MKISKNFNNERQFGLLFSLVFFILFLITFFNQGLTNYIYLIASFFLLLISLIKPNLYFYPNKYWLIFGNILGRLFTPIIIGLLFVALFLPIGILLKIFRKDVLEMKILKNKGSYWKKNKLPDTDFNRQF